jgi:hypothetical protein
MIAWVRTHLLFLNLKSEIVVFTLKKETSQFLAFMGHVTMLLLAESPTF